MEAKTPDNEEQQHYSAAELSEKLYPTPKTYAQLAADRRRLDALRDKRIARFTPLSTNFLIAGVILLIIKSENIMTTLVDTLGAMGGVFSTFIVGLTAIGIGIWQCIRANRYFTNHGLPGSWYVGVLIMSGFAAIWMYIEILREQSWQNLLLTMTAYYLVTALLGICTMNAMLARTKR